MTAYKLSYSNAATQYIDITVTVATNGNSHITLQLPAWRPGRYELGNFAKNIKNFRVEDAEGNALAFQKIVKDCWEVETNGAETLVAKYSFYSNVLNAGNTWLDNNQLYVNPVNCCMYAAGYENEPCTVAVEAPRAYQFACALQHLTEHTDTKSTFIFQAEHFDQLADTPFIASATLKHADFEEAGVKFHLWFQGECKPDLARITADFKAFATKMIATMGGMPVDEYHFYYQILPQPFHHGVEHLQSTVIALGPGYALMNGATYEDFLGVSCHELFHVWNIKTIRPAEMLPYDFTGENYFETGFVAEGVTTYYGDVFLLRSKVFSANTYLDLLADTIKRHYHNYGRFNLSIAHSGFDNWLDGYVPGAPHRKVSIYNEGCLLAFMLDVQIRKHSNNTKSLDDVMRRLYNEFGLQNIGYTTQDYQRLAEEEAGADFSTFFTEYVFGTKPYNDLLNECLNYLGLTLVQSTSAQACERNWGFKVEGNKVAMVAPNSPAEHAGLMIGDSIIAVNNITITGSPNNWLEYFSGEAVKLTVNNNGYIKELYLHPTTETFYHSYQLKLKEENVNYTAWAN